MTVEIFNEEHRRPTPEMIVGNFINIENKPVKNEIDELLYGGEIWMFVLMGPPGSAKTTTRLYLKSCNVPSVELLYEDCLRDFRTAHPGVTGERYMSKLQSNQFVSLMTNRALQMHSDNPDKVIIAEFPSGMHREEPDQALKAIINNTKGQKGIMINGIRKRLAILQIEATQDVHQISDTWRDSIQNISEEEARALNIFDEWSLLRSAATSLQSMSARENHDKRLSAIFENVDDYLQRRKLTLEFATRQASMPPGLNIQPADWKRICKNWIALGHYYSFIGGNHLILAVNPAIEDKPADFPPQTPY